MKKNKCTVCSRVKGKRKCKIREETMICPRCCAEIRGDECEECFHYAQAEENSAEKMEKASKQHFIARLDPEVDDAVDKTLEFVETGNLAKGEELLAGLLAKHPDLYIVQYGMGTVQAMKGNHAESIVYFDKAIEIYPYFVEAWFNRGNAYQKLLDEKEIFISFQKVVEFGDPNEDYVIYAKKISDHIEESTYHNTGLSMEQYFKSMDDFKAAFKKMEGRNYEEAIIGFQKVAAQNKTNAQPYGNLGLCYACLGKKDEALSALDKALALDPDYEPAIKNKRVILALGAGERLGEQGEPFQSVEYYKEKALSEREGK